MLSPLIMMPKTWPLCISAESSIRDRVWGEVEKNKFYCYFYSLLLVFLLYLFQTKGLETHAPGNCFPTWEDLVWCFIAEVQGRDH